MLSRFSVPAAPRPVIFDIDQALFIHFVFLNCCASIFLIISSLGAERMDNIPTTCLHHHHPRHVSPMPVPMPELERLGLMLSNVKSRSGLKLIISIFVALHRFRKILHRLRKLLRAGIPIPMLRLLEPYTPTKILGSTWKSVVFCSRLKWTRFSTILRKPAKTILRLCFVRSCPRPSKHFATTWHTALLTSFSFPTRTPVRHATPS
jgi:hypothetical protein